MTSLNSVMRFGKYRGLTVGAILKFNPLYIDWALDNIDGFALDDEAKRIAFPAIRKEREFSLNQQNAWAWGFGRGARGARHRHTARQIEIEHEERRKAGQVCEIDGCGRITWSAALADTHAERGDVKQAPSLMSGAARSEAEGNAQTQSGHHPKGNN